MKKKLILLPLLLLVLGACGSSVEPSSSSSEPASSEVAEDTNVYRVVGSFSDPQWVVDSADYVMEKATGENVFTFEALDLFVDEEWQITINGVWDGQIGFTSSITVVDPDTTMGEGGGYTPKNFKVLTDGNYDIELDTSVTPRQVTITRNGDPIDVPIVEENPDSWFISGDMNEWALGDEEYELVEDEYIADYYVGVFDLEANVKFKITTPLDTTYTYARGSAQVQADPVPAWLDITSDSAIEVLEAGTYSIEFGWVASVGATVNGVILIEQLELPYGYTTIPNILDLGVVGNSYTTRGVVVGVNGGSIFIEDPETQKALNVYESPSVLKDTLLVGNVIDVTGTYKLFNTAAELDAAVITLFAAEADPAVEPVVIADGAALTARMGTDPTLSGQLIRLNDVTVGPVHDLNGNGKFNYFDFTFDGVTIMGYSWFSLAYETGTPATGTGRTAINALIADLNTSGETFDVIGVLYHASSTPGTWNLGICTTDYIIQTPAV
jgi:hypothetical protein